MKELFETVFILSVFGFAIISLLLILKPITAKSFPAKWQYYAWIAVLISMLVPTYKFIPQKEAQRLSAIVQTQEAPKETIMPSDTLATDATPSPDIYRGAAKTNGYAEYIKKAIANIRELFPYIWILGVLAYALAVTASYITYLYKKRRNSILITNNSVFEKVKNELGIKRKLRLKMSEDILSPILVGILFPTVYLPAKAMEDEALRMVFLHELTHYKRGDLIVKWLSLIVNAIHWFNPLSYILCANVSEACEISCDMTVSHNMSESEQKLYMQTILNLAGGK